LSNFAPLLKVRSFVPTIGVTQCLNLQKFEMTFSWES
jgi:hypothetical protein